MVGYRKTTKVRVEQIAARLKMPKVTVDRIVNEYLASIKHDVLCGDDVTVNNLFSLKVVPKEDGRLTVRGSVSAALKAEAARSFARMQSEEAEEASAV